jgi:hypothetical protein
VHCPSVPMNAHWPLSRAQTARRTADGIRRESDVVPRGRWGRDTDASVVFSRCCSSIVNPRSNTIATSPSGHEWRIRSCTRRNFSNTSLVTVNCTL